MNAYALTFGVLLLSGGKLADLFGGGAIFIAGLVIFTVASLWCGLAGGAGSLIAARTVQGVGAALMNPATLSIITATFPPRQRGTAIGIWAGVSALALAIGPLVGGLLTEHVSWSWIFFVNIPVGMLAIVAARLFIDETRDTSREQRLDLPGLVTSAVGLFALTYGLIETNTHAWGSARVLALLAVGVVSLVALRAARVAAADPDARPVAVPQPDVRRREHGDGAGRTGDVRRLLLQLAVHPEHPRLQRDPDRRDVPADDAS